MELSLINNPDSLKNFYSLDAPYFVSFGKGFLTFKAKESHIAITEEELSFHEGEMIEVTGTRGDGFSVGRKKGTKEKGLIPSDKIKIKLMFRIFLHILIVLDLVMLLYLLIGTIFHSNVTNISQHTLTIPAYTFLFVYRRSDFFNIKPQYIYYT